MPKNKKLVLNSGTQTFWRTMMKCVYSKSFEYSLSCITEWQEPTWVKVKSSWQILLQHQSTYPKEAQNLHQYKYPPFSDLIFQKLLGIYFDAAVVFVKNFSLLFRLALWPYCEKQVCGHGLSNFIFMRLLNYKFVSLGLYVQLVYWGIHSNLAQMA